MRKIPPPVIASNANMNNLKFSTLASNPRRKGWLFRANGDISKERQEKNKITFCKAYDTCGKISVNFVEGKAYRIGRAASQPVNEKSTVIKFEAGETSRTFAAATATILVDAETTLLSIDIAKTEEMY